MKIYKKKKKQKIWKKILTVKHFKNFKKFECFKIRKTQNFISSHKHSKRLQNTKTASDYLPNPKNSQNFSKNLHPCPTPKKINLRQPQNVFDFSTT